MRGDRVGIGLIIWTLGAGAGDVGAAPIQATGQAAISEAKGPVDARAHALGVARRAALESAFDQVPEPIDATARKTVLGAVEAWTGAYRILAVRSGTDQLEVDVEVDIDLTRLTKRVQQRATTASLPTFRLGEIRSAPECGPYDAMASMVRTEWSDTGVVAPAQHPSARPLDLMIECQGLGPVHHTHWVGVVVGVRAMSKGRVQWHSSGPSFAESPSEAIVAGVHQRLFDIGERMSRARGTWRIRVHSPLPSARVRRLEAAIRNSVVGVDEVRLQGVARGVVELQVHGKLELEVLADRLGGLSLPGFSIRIDVSEPPDVLNIHLE